MIRLAPAFLALCAACSAPDMPDDCRLAVAGYPGERLPDAVAMAASRWNATGASYCTVEFGAEIANVFFADCTGASGYYWGDTITVCSKTVDVDLVILHEVGHALGATHHGGNGIMAIYKSGRFVPYITRDDLDSMGCTWCWPEE
jgi:hypothetical protein